MPLIDERGRLLGRINIVDAAIVLLLVLMLPVAYGAYWLFRDPPARLTGVQPAVLTAGINLQVQVVGENFRPYMRVSFGTNQGGGFQFRSDRLATVGVPDMPSGKYDVVLYDFAQEVSRLKDALTINVPTYPVIPVTLSGTFVNLSVDQASRFKKGQKLPEDGQPVATIMELDAPQPSVARISAGNLVLPVAVEGSRDLPATISL